MKNILYDMYLVLNSLYRKGFIGVFMHQYEQYVFPIGNFLLIIGKVTASLNLDFED